MNKPCENCDKADKKKTGYFKCDSPCGLAKQCHETDKLLLDVLSGKIKTLGEVME